MPDRTESRKSPICMSIFLGDVALGGCWLKSKDTCFIAKQVIGVVVVEK